MKNIITKKIVRKLKSKTNTEFEEFYRKHVKGNTEFLSIVLKYHLRVEMFLDRLICSTFLRPDQLLGARFVDKTEIVYASGVINSETLSALKGLNKIRNKFAHNLDYKISKEDIQLVYGNRKPKGKSKLQRFIVGISYIAGYLSAIANVTETLPFYMSGVNNHKLYIKDPTFNKAVILNQREIVLEFLDKLKMVTTE